MGRRRTHRDSLLDIPPSGRRTALYMQKQQRAEAMAAKGTKLHEAATRPPAVPGKERQAGHESSARRGSR